MSLRLSLSYIKDLYWALPRYQFVLEYCVSPEKRSLDVRVPKIYFVTWHFVIKSALLEVYPSGGSSHHNVKVMKKYLQSRVILINRGLWSCSNDCHLWGPEIWPIPMENMTLTAESLKAGVFN